MGEGEVFFSLQLLLVRGFLLLRLVALLLSGVSRVSTILVSRNFCLHSVGCFWAFSALCEQLLLHHCGGGEAVLLAHCEQLLLHLYFGGSEAVHLF